MKKKNPFRYFTPFERRLWMISCILIAVLFLCHPARDLLALLASLTGVTALIFLARGEVLGQLLIIVFSLLYAVISFRFRYFGEMITYIGMTAPMAALAAIEWLKNPYVEKEEKGTGKGNAYGEGKGGSEVRVAELTRHKVLWLVSLTTIVTILFYFVLKYFETNHLVISTISIATSFAAAALTFLRSPCYALAYAGNDLVLIVLWTLAASEDMTFLPMILCFVIFLINDLYGFVNWRRMRERQKDRTTGRREERAPDHRGDVGGTDIL